MLEMRKNEVRVVRCQARPEALDALRVPAGVHACRVAPDELLLVGRPAEVNLPDGLVVEETGGWAAWTLSGKDAGEALGRLSALPCGPGFSQGLVAGVPAKVVADGAEVHLLVAASHGHHVEERVQAACSDLIVG